jgi:hypothetical protein
MRPHLLLPSFRFRLSLLPLLPQPLKFYRYLFLPLPLPAAAFYRRRSLQLLFSIAGARSRLFLLPPFPLDVVFHRRHF